MDTQSLIIFLVIGMVAGWLAGVLVKGGGFGLLGDMVVGVLGAFIGGWLFARTGVTTWGIGGLLVTALVGAVVLLIIVRLIKRV